MLKKLILILPIIFLVACDNDKDMPDAYGNFEADEIFVSAEGNGKILKLDINEGIELDKNQEIGLIDTTDLHLMKKELYAKINSINAKTRNISVEIDVLEKQKANAERELKRFKTMKEDGAATQKQIDDLIGQIELIDKQIIATKSGLGTANQGLLAEIPALKVKIEQIEYQINKALIKNPIKGTVITTYAEENEFTATGKPLYKIADLENLELRIYISENQLSKVKIGDEIIVGYDNGDELNKTKGKLIWISEKAEFTPKIIQTKEERKNLVYAAKVLVKNDGSLKIGMPAEVYFK